MPVYLSDVEKEVKEQQKCIAGLLEEIFLSYFIRNFNFNLSLTPHSPRMCVYEAVDDTEVRDGKIILEMKLISQSGAECEE